MPYFYKLGDYYKNPEDWLKKVEFTISDFIYGCESKGKTGKVYIFLIDDSNNIIVPHSGGLTYEYFTETEIPPKFIIFEKKKKINKEDLGHDGKLLYNTKIQLIKWFDKRQKKNYNNLYYIHITCEENLDSIIKNGIYAETQIKKKNRIGNRSDSNNNLNNSNLSNSSNGNDNSNGNSKNEPPQKKRKIVGAKTPNKIKNKSYKNKSKKNKSKKNNSKKNKHKKNKSKKK